MYVKPDVDFHGTEKMLKAATGLGGNTFDGRGTRFSLHVSRHDGVPNHRALGSEFASVVDFDRLRQTASL